MAWSGRAWASPASSSCGAASAIAAAAPTAPAAATACPAFPESESAGGGGAPASRSAALPARPWPSRGAIQELGRRRLWGSGADSAGARLHLQRPPLRRHRQPTVAARPNPEAGSAERADRAGSGGGGGHRPRGRRPWRQRRGRRSGPSRLDRPHPGRARPRGAPNPGTWGRPGTRSTGSTPPGARRPAGRVGTRRSTGVDGPGSLTVHRGRRRKRRTDRPGHRPCWAALAQSSAR